MLRWALSPNSFSEPMEEWDLNAKSFLHSWRKKNERYAVVIAWLKTRISFEILKSVHVSVRRTRSPFYRKELEVVDDFGLTIKVTGVF